MTSRKKLDLARIGGVQAFQYVDGSHLLGFEVRQERRVDAARRLSDADPVRFVGKDGHDRPGSIFNGRLVELGASPSTVAIGERWSGVPDGGSVGIVTAGDGPDPPFGLELYAPSGADVKLRFWVRVEGSTHSAECSAVQFLQGQSYLITGAYDGNGRVRLWIDHGVRGVAPSRALRGPIEPAGDPLILGARPAISGRPAIPAFRGRIRHLMVRGWGPRES